MTASSGQSGASADAASAAEPAELGDLMSRYQKGSMEAFERLYELLEPPLRRYLRSLVWGSIEAEDLVQATFLQLHRARRTHLPGMAVRPWTFGIARHVALMARRTTGRRAQHETPARDELPEVAVASSASTVLDRVELERLLGRLPDDRREALWLHHVGGLSFGEVAAVQGISETAAKVRAHRALHRLRGEVTESEA